MHPRRVSKKRPDLLDLATLACESRVKMSNKDLLHCCSCFRNEAPREGTGEYLPARSSKIERPMVRSPQISRSDRQRSPYSLILR
jgi:hypothetical protein